MANHDDPSRLKAILPDLKTLTLQLRRIHSAAVVAQLALRAQQAEQDLEIADTLRASVCDALGVQITALERSARRLRSPRA